MCCTSLGPLSTLKSTLCFESMVSSPYLVAENKVSTLYLCVLCSDMNSSALGTLEFPLALSELLSLKKKKGAFCHIDCCVWETETAHIYFKEEINFTSL